MLKTAARAFQDSALGSEEEMSKEMILCVRKRKNF